MPFEDVGQQWDRDEPWQTQQTGRTIRALSSGSPWVGRQVRTLGLVLLALVVTTVVLALLF